MLRKQLGLIVTMLLPVSVLMIGFLVTHSDAWLKQSSYANETADPAACGDNYRINFGVDRPHSPSYCPPNNLVEASESASFSSSWFNDDHIHWYRQQIWTFDNPYAWGTRCKIERDEEIHYSWFGADNADYTGGYWDGVEMAWRGPTGTNIYKWADNVRWFQKEINGVRYRCPKYHIYTRSPSWFDCLDSNPLTYNHWSADSYM